MNILLTILCILGGLLIVFLLAAWIFPKHYSVAVSETIRAPKSTVYEFVSLFQFQPQYSEWLKADPTLQPEITGTDGTVGAVLKWESRNEDKKKNVGTGEQEIKRMDENNIEVELRLIKPMPATCKLVHHIVEQGAQQAIYTCTFFAYAKFPINLPAYLLGRGFISKTQQKTLSNIKAIIEQSAISK